MGTSTVSKNKRSKAAKSALVVVLALALALGGTFATFYGTQMGLNEGARTTSENPGGRVHDDFGNRTEDAAGKVSFDKNVYAESFTDRHDNGEYLVARIRLKNYAEINTDANNPGKVTKENKTQGTYGQVDTYTTVTYDKAVGFKSNLHFGDASAVQPAFSVGIYGGINAPSKSANSQNQYRYMPTFKKQMTGAGSDEVDVKGAYPDYLDYPLGTIKGGDVTKTEPAYYDGGKQYEEQHTSKLTVPGYRGVTTITDWNDDTKTPEKDNWWVYDESDGWFYWSSPLVPNNATGLLLDGLEVTGDDLDWYYALNVEGEFITLDTYRGDNTDGKYYWCKEDGTGVVKEVANETVSDLIGFVQNIDNNYQASISKAIDEATILKEVATPTDGVYEAALVDLSEGVGAAKKGEEVYVLYKDTKNRKALVITRYLSEKWGTDGTGFGPFDAGGITDWDKSQAKVWCDGTYYTSLPTKLQAMIPQTKIDYVADGVLNTQLQATSHVFFLGATDYMASFNWTRLRDSTVKDTLLFNSISQPRATLPNGNEGCYWSRTDDGVGRVTYINEDGAGRDNVWPDSCINVATNEKVNMGARPAFWINY